jgi:ABC-type lipoprotein export system ATPase subunit
MSNLFVIEASQVGRVYWDGDRKLQVLKNVSLTVDQGESVAVLGPSGCGKTTLLNVLSGLDTPSEGSVKLEGKDIHRLSDPERAAYRNRRIGFVFQFYHLLPEFNALENVMLPALIAGARPTDPEARKRAEGLLDRLGLKDRAAHFPGELSGGEQQRVALARSLMNDPAILFCDEPTGNLDPESAKGVATLLKELTVREKKTVLMVTHDEAMARLASRVWSLSDGRWLF